MKHYIILRKPNEINHKRIVTEINKLVDSGVKLSDILPQLNFVVDDLYAWNIFDKFKIIKNRIAFKRNPIFN